MIHRIIDRIIIHCTATREGMDITTEDIDRYHRARGFRGIGYHYVIYRDGSVHQGRSEDEIGAHCTGFNAHSIGVCYVGGLAPDGKTPKDTRTAAQKAALTNLIADLLRRYPKAILNGHNEFANKACPCFDVQKEYGSLIKK